MTVDDWTSELKTRWMGRNLEYTVSVDSTNQRLKDRLAAENLALGSAWLSDQQTAGRGRLGRTWWSPPSSGLYTSFVVYPGNRLSAVLSLLAAVALSEAIDHETRVATVLKWPNDVLAEGKKCAGILVESGSIPQPWAVIGIGINVNGTLPESYAQAITLASASHGNVSRHRLWALLAGRLEWWYEAWLSDGPGKVLDAWRLRSATLNQEVEVHAEGKILYIGKAVDIDSEGALLVETKSAGLKRVVAGEVSVRFPGGRYHPEA